jgi:hypothetical protein
MPLFKKRQILTLLLLTPPLLLWSADSDSRDYETLLDRASDYANDAYYSNVDGAFEEALAYIDSAMVCLNAHYRHYAPQPHLHPLALVAEEEPAELDWWNSTFNSDFHVILDIRNEAAVAFLALKQWDAYNYNNAAYTTLYKLLGEDRSLEAYCNALERSTRNRTVGIILAVCLMGTLLAGYYFLYIRKRLVNRWNLEQLLEINKKVFAATATPNTDISEDDLAAIPQRIEASTFDAINELVPINHMRITVQDEPTEALPAPSAPADMGTFPLVVESDNGKLCVGMLYLQLRDADRTDTSRLTLELVARYIAIVIYNTVVRLSSKYRDIETAQDEVARAAREESVLHVQNQVLDNCLSTIKHETVYYPNKIKQLIGRLRAGRLSEREEQETVRAIGELIEYYKGIFTILSSCASRQLEEVVFRRTAVGVRELFDYADRFFRKAANKERATVTFQPLPPAEALSVSGDLTELRFLLECLMTEALAATADNPASAAPPSDALRLQAAPDGDYIRFRFTDPRRPKPTDELNTLFYPHRGHGAEYLLCKQVIRDHDEFAGRRGCRINAEQAPQGGFTVFFTVPRYVSPDQRTLTKPSL